MRSKALLGREEGSAIVLVGLSMVLLLAMAGLVIDLGTVFATKVQLQKTANAAVLSGAQELTNTQSAVTDVVNQVLTDHGELSSLVNTSIEMKKKVSVDLNRDVPLAFSKLFGLASFPVGAHAAAEIQPMVGATGVVPLGIPSTTDLTYYTDYTLKVDETGVDTGNFGVLALGGPGAQTYEDNLKYGYQSKIETDDIIDTQTGNVAGKTRDAIQDRINRCPYPVGETYHRDCPRTILIPVYDPWEISVNQVKKVKITGFAYFYIMDPMNWQDKTIHGMFIEYAGTGVVNPVAKNYGAYGIRLTE
ncbi:pilus assembly protein TadG-related protein [Ferviditalea candida]|uniref:TadE/TadG family type IV pilus assembly protein n=1 Tax=Ferviditalea candida TaxID=3108399 RepID=A0ABU5ZEE7_9BACL|nr:TadE/TadG family type IV pilus assembly protein [Paenibacillaceae bacterium T2]